ncbi:rCG20267 [Rattus norvegicus]|uniref:RCG20267 n=1 Tax=Rattus norvegicus TaxID=10116 RepID=A6JH44_RAT|nr:rCG20267 [Rattus norvegicus]
MGCSQVKGSTPILWSSKSPQISSELSPLLEEPAFWKSPLPCAWKDLAEALFL